MDYCDDILHTHWYWQDVAQEIVKCHLGLAEALPRFKFWTNSKTGPISWNFLNILIKLCINIAIDVELDRGIAKCHFSSVAAMPRSKSEKQVNLTLSAFGTFWYASVQILKKKVKLKRTLHIFIHIFICYKKVQTPLDIIFLCVCNIGSAILHFRL